MYSGRCLHLHLAKTSLEDETTHSTRPRDIKTAPPIKIDGFEKSHDNYWLWHIVPNYYGTEHLLAQHPDKFGKKKIIGVEVVEKLNKELDPDVILHIGDKE
jgi:hypothetical protein